MSMIGTCIWYNGTAEEAAEFYCGIIPNSKVIEKKYYLEGGPGVVGSVLTVLFTLDGTEYLALNGGPHYPLTPAMSIMVYCDTQDEVDRYWNALSEGGEEGQCGWLVDRFGLSWQIVPRIMMNYLNTADVVASQRAWNAMISMRKLDIATIEAAYRGEPTN